MLTQTSDIVMGAQLKNEEVLSTSTFLTRKHLKFCCKTVNTSCQCGCVRTLCAKLSTSLEQLLDNLQHELDRNYKVSSMTLIQQECYKIDNTRL